MLIVLRLTASLAYSSILFPIRDINNSYMLSFNKSVSVTEQPRGWLVVQPLSFHILDSGFWNLCILTAIRVFLIREVQVGAIFDRVTFLPIGYAGYGIQTSEFIWSASCFDKTRDLDKASKFIFKRLANITNVYRRLSQLKDVQIYLAKYVPRVLAFTHPNLHLSKPS